MRGVVGCLAGAIASLREPHAKHRECRQGVQPKCRPARRLQEGCEFVLTLVHIM